MRESAREVPVIAGDVAHYSGAPYHKTPKEKMLPVTVMFSVSGADKKRFLDYVAKNPST